MTASLETLVVAAYVFADSLRIPRPGPAGKITDEELIALAVAQAATGLCSDRQFLGVVAKLLPGYFPQLPDQTQYHRRLRRLAPFVCTVQLIVAELIAEGRVRLADGTLIACANYPGCASHSHFAGHASFGYCPSKSEFVWGMRLVLVSDPKGVPVGYDLVDPKTGTERECAFELAQAHPGSALFCDGGFWGAEYERTMELIDVQLVTPDKHKLGERPAAEQAKARIRLVIESVISNLKRQMRLEDHLAKTLGGLVQRIAQRPLALTVGMLGVSRRRRASRHQLGRPRPGNRLGDLMPRLRIAKQRLADQLGSAATAGEGRQNMLCATSPARCSSACSPTRWSAHVGWTRPSACLSRGGTRAPRYGCGRRNGRRRHPGEARPRLPDRRPGAWTRACAA